ncbi:RHS repeat-associated core domain-containing protein [Caldithrix abyssi DSM 13497]|uniref:RHS repeat-associated core domain-containing protein n=1 Tax=Caldithrix abyssi DSM 13497 TaxID=880073 RepID=H1XUP5_CALAY|nr:interleukin-like EMT inducer domain-containing protein [Caldithrix abyssi]APF16793.1 RHS repeat-associated core domain-containing protein [Caldithrix abyssi DSM 13497]EHO40544.1 RHS repeat-associated core domain-containing protein [Caldithrix abyssi DSM 13497]
MKKYFYLKDHLGNIRVTVDENGDVEGYNDYYPFGLQMPGRSMNNALATDMYKYSSKELDEEGLTGYTPFSVRVISKGYLDGNAAAIYVNDSYISGSGLYARGYTIVVVDENGTVVDKAHFDTYSSTAEADAMADFINNVATGHYVIGVIKDDGSQSMTENAYNALASVGCQHSRDVGYRYSYAFIGKKGESSCGYEAYAHAGHGFVDKTIGDLRPLAWYYFGARYYDPAIGRFLRIDRYDYKYPSLNPYHYVFNNPIRFTDFTGDTVDIDPKLLTPVVYTEGKKKGQSKSIKDMTPEEKQRYFFQLWWNNNKKEILSLFGIGGKYETTNILFKLGTYPRKWFGINFGSVKSFIGHTAWAKRGTDEGYFYHGGGFFDGGKLYSDGVVNPEFGIDELQINVYFNPNLSRDIPFTAPHEWKHVKIIFDAVKNGRPVPNGINQHKLVKNDNLPEIK